jgi:hypothetical protein
MKNNRHLNLTGKVLLCLLGLQFTIAAQTTIQTFTYVGSIQTFTVPPCVYQMTIQANGAQGGYHSTSTINSGLGASIRGVITVTPGQVLKILVGQQPSQTTAGNGGGGGSFVTDNSNAPLIIAGGGGGSSTGADSPAKHGQTGTSGGTGAGGGGAGGTNGSGGFIGASFASGAGGGLLTNGQTGWTANTGGIAFVNGGNATTQAAIGGFGGGGSGSAYVVGGGGGGYSGGGSGSNSSGNGVGGGGGSFNAGTNQVNISGANTGHGVVTFTFTQGAPVAANVSSSVICSGNSVTITASGVNSYTWAPAGSFGGSNAPTIIVSPPSNTTYSVSGTNSLGCITNLSIPIIVNLTPTVTASASSASICNGNTVALNGAGANTYAWTGGVTNGTPFAPSSTSGYTVTGTNACGTATAALVVTVSPLIVSAAASPTLTCAGSTATLTASGAANYSWAPGSLTGSNVLVSPQVPTTYTLVGAVGMCTGSAVYVLPVDPVPTIMTTATETQVCAYESVTLTASGGLSYTWNPGNLIGSQIVVTPSVPSSYVVTGINQFSCTSSTQTIVIANPNPTVQIAQSATAVCSNGTVNLVASGTGGTYSWSTGGSGTSTTVPLSQLTVFTVTLTNQYTCSASASVQVNVYEPTVSISQPTGVCLGTGVTLAAGAAVGYTWLPQNSGFSSITFTPQATATYTLKAMVNMANAVCLATNTAVVVVNPNPTVTASTTRTVVCRNEKGTLNANGATSYTWNTLGNGSSVVATFSINGSQTYSLAGTDDNGCKGSASLKIQVNPCNDINETGKAADFSIYPNPGKTAVTVTSGVTMRLVMINALGQKIGEHILDESNDHSISVTGLSDGIYFIYGPDSQIKKLVISR